MNDPAAPRLNRILVASDLSEDSDVAVAAAAALAAAAGAELHAIHCVQNPVFPYWEGLVPESTKRVWLDSARTDLEWQVRRVLGEVAPEVALEVQVGEPSRHIGEFARQLGADLLVVGPHRPRHAFDDLLGTIADRLIRSASVPCLVANRPLRPPLRQILFPVDFSQPSNHCVSVGAGLLAGSLLASEGDETPSIIEVLFVSAFAIAVPRPASVEPMLAAHAESIRSRLPAGCAARVLPRILSAPLPADGIRSAAERMDADLVVLGTHGYGTLGRALIGSVATTVARTVPFSLLMVPPPGA